MDEEINMSKKPTNQTRKKARKLAGDLTAHQLLSAGAILFFIDQARSKEEFLAACTDAYENFNAFF